MSRRPMTPERMLAAIVGEFGRSLVAVSELMERSFIKVVQPSEVDDFVFKDAILTMPGENIIQKVAAARRESKPTPLPKDEASRAPMRRAILISLAQFGRAMTPAQIGLYSGKAHKGGAFVAAFSDLKAEGCVEQFPNFGGCFRVTPAGLEELGDWARLPEGMALFEHWCSKLGPMAEAILRCLLSVEQALTPAEIGERIGKAHKGGAFVEALSALKKMGLVAPWMTKGTFQISADLRRAVAPSVRVFDKSSGTEHRLDAHKGHAR